MPCGYIYKIVFPNGNNYIGLTPTSLEQIKREHKNSTKSGDTIINFFFANLSDKKSSCV